MNMLKKYKNLYANGDSFVFGMEILGDDNRNFENKNKSFAAHLAKSLDRNLVNNSYNSCTNEFIFRKTIIDLENLIKAGTNPNDTFVVIGWTALHREEIVAKHILDYYHAGKAYKFKSDSQEHTDFGTFFISPSHSQKMRIVANGTVQTIDIVKDAAEFCSMFVWDDDFQQEKAESKILALQNYLEHKGFRYLFVNTCGTYKEFKLIDCVNPRFFSFEQSFFEWGKQHYPNNIRLKNHFDELPHQKYADLLFDHITKNSL